jgi:hypothetical protein
MLSVSGPIELVEALRDGDEGHAVLVKEVDQLREVHQGPGQAIDLVDDDTVRLAGQQALEGGSFEAAARVPLSS